jgi:hypothetical protein
MKKTLIFCFILLPLFVLKGQTTLTNAQVYDYNVGDTIQGLYNTPWAAGGMNPYTYQTQIITAKIFSTGNDTIFYTIKTNLYTPVSYYGSPAVHSTSTGIDTVTHLNSVAAQYNNSGNQGCGGTTDTTFTDSCGYYHWQRKPVKVWIGCNGPPNIETTDLIKGVGHFYGYSTVNNAPEGHMDFSFVYSSKGPNQCGRFVTAVDESMNRLEGGLIYPNPGDGIFNLPVKHPEANYRLIVLNRVGQEVLKISLKGELLKIDLRDQPPGIYLYRLVLNGISEAAGKVIIR